MFMQIIEGPVRDEERFRRETERWAKDLKPGSVGYLGATWGLAPDGTGFLAARFESKDAAEANSRRTEQGEWWSALEPAFEKVSFHDCDEVDTMLSGGSADAGFVQVIEGRVKDQGAARAMLNESEGELAETRPDILGGVMAWHGTSGEFTQVMYFRSEQDARTGETSMADADVDTRYQDMMAVEPRFIDLTSPHFD
jgi:hypothetical protein